jgi:hypothetical protein
MHKMIVWFQTLSPNASAMVGTLIGSFFGLVALLFGALFNSYLTRRRDNRIRNQDKSAVLSAVKAELQHIQMSFQAGADGLRDVGYEVDNSHFLAPDVSMFIRVLPLIIDKIGLMDRNTIMLVMRAYSMIENYPSKLALLGGARLRSSSDLDRMFQFPPTSRKSVCELCNNFASDLGKVIHQL